MTADAPVSGRNFIVRVTRRGPRRGVQDEFELACRQVILPVLHVGEPAPRGIGPFRPVEERVESSDVPDVEPGADDLLVLRRGHTGSPELSDWWTHERTALLRGSHDVEITVLDDAGHAVTTWTFTGCHLVALRYSALDAVGSNVFMETAEVTFDAVTQRPRR